MAPAELQGYVEFAVGVLAVSKQRDAAQAPVTFMSSPEAAPLIPRNRGKSRVPPRGVLGGPSTPRRVQVQGHFDPD
jgi:hypothetical protein